jgi:hypothetical protein
LKVELWVEGWVASLAEERADESVAWMVDEMAAGKAV